jgi:N,N'-diacetyllegionaminate synthase
MILNIGNKIIGEDESVFVIAEVAQAHDGSLGTAHAYIDAVSRRGVDAIKFQTHIADAESSPQEQFRVPFSYQDSSRYEYWKRMEFTREQWTGLANHAKDKGLIFLSSPFSEEAVVLLDEIGCPAWKVGSGEIGSIHLINRMIATNKPIILSSGMSDWPELDLITNHIKSHNGKFCILQSTTEYPCPPERWGLNNISEIINRYNCIAGFSDHSGSIAAGLAAVALGAKILEVHITFSKECFGPDTLASIPLDQLGDLIEGVRKISTAKNNPVDKNVLVNELLGIKKIFGKSIFAAKNLKAGKTLLASDLIYKKPGDGISSALAEKIIGKKICVSLKKNQMLQYEHIVNNN